MLGAILRSSAGAAPPASTYLPAGDTSLYPQIAVEIEFDNDPTTTLRTWTNVTEYVRQIQWSSGGRQHELARVDAGTLTAVLDNGDARFDPANTGSPYYPGVKRMRWIRVKASWASVEYDRWAGLIETWTQNWPGLGSDAICIVRAVDAFKILALADLGGLSYSEQLSGSRVAFVLADIGVPYTADAGQTTIVASDSPISVGTKALAHLQDVADTENGLLFADATGQIVFQDRHFRLTNAASLTSADTIGDIAGEIPYREGTLDYDDTDVWPTVKVTPEGGTVETASDATSQALHFDRTLERTILSSSQNEALASAQWLSYRYADPEPRIPAVELLPQTATSKWPTVLAAENSNRFTWTRRAAATLSMDVFVERVSESVVPGRGWTVQWQLSPTSNVSYWVLDVAGLSELDATTRLVY